MRILTSILGLTYLVTFATSASAYFMSVKELRYVAEETWVISKYEAGYTDVLTSFEFVLLVDCEQAHYAGYQRFVDLDFNRQTGEIDDIQTGDHWAFGRALDQSRRDGKAITFPVLSMLATATDAYAMYDDQNSLDTQKLLDVCARMHGGVVINAAIENEWTVR